MIKHLLYSIFILVLASCDLSPKYKTPETNLKLEADSGKNYSEIEIDQFFLSPNMQKVIERAYLQNRDVKIAALNLDVMMKRYDISKSDLMPEVSVNGSYYKSDPITNKKYTVGLMASYEIDLFGKVNSKRKSTLYTFLAEEENLKSTKLSIISEVVSLYVLLLADLENIKNLEDFTQIQQEQLKIVEEQYNAGIVTELDFLNIQSFLEQTKARLVSYKMQFEKNKKYFEYLIADDSNAYLSPEDTLEGIKFDEDLLKNVVSESLLERPDVKRAELQLKAANANVGAARAAFFPSISLTGMYGYASNQLSDLFSSKFWYFNPQVNIPIFTGFANKSALDIAKLESNIYIAQYTNVINNAFTDAHNAITTRQSIKESFGLIEANFVQSKKINEITKVRYEAGIDSLNDFIDTQKTVLNINETYINAKKDYILSLIDLYKAFGGSSSAWHKLDSKE